MIDIIMYGLNYQILLRVVGRHLYAVTARSRTVPETVHVKRMMNSAHHFVAANVQKNDYMERLFFKAC